MHTYILTCVNACVGVGGCSKIIYIIIIMIIIIIIIII